MVAFNSSSGRLRKTPCCALDVICGYWGAMLDLGATSFWEHFELDWAREAARIDEVPQPGQSDLHQERGAICFQGYRHSLCHGWACGPAPFLSRHVLGIDILEAGCRRVRVAPQLGDLSWAEGDFPTPHGPIGVRHERLSGGAVESHIEALPEITIQRETSL